MTTILVFLLAYLSLVHSQDEVKVSDRNVFSTISYIFANMLNLLQKKPEILEQNYDKVFPEDCSYEGTKFGDTSVSNDYTNGDSYKELDEMFSEIKHYSFVGGQSDTFGLTPEDVVEHVLKVEQILEEYNKVQ